MPLVGAVVMLMVSGAVPLMRLVKLRGVGVLAATLRVVAAPTGRVPPVPVRLTVRAEMQPPQGGANGTVSVAFLAPVDAGLKATVIVQAAPPCTGPGPPPAGQVPPVIKKSAALVPVIVSDPRAAVPVPPATATTKIVWAALCVARA